MVANITPQRLIEMFELMAELEAMCARLAIRRMSDEEFAAIKAAHEACRAASQASDADAYFYANERFHYAIYAASHKASCSIRRRRCSGSCVRRLQLRVRNRLQRSFSEHETIIEAMGAGDVESAMANVRAHVIVQGERFADLVASLSRLTDRAEARRAAPAAEPVGLALAR